MTNKMRESKNNSVGMKTKKEDKEKNKKIKKREKKEKEKKRRKNQSGKKIRPWGKSSRGGEKKRKRERRKKKIFPVLRQSELDSSRTKIGLCNESYTWVSKSEFFVEAPRGRVFSYTGSSLFKSHKWPCGSAQTCDLIFGHWDCFSDSLGLGFEGQYPG